MNMREYWERRYAKGGTSGAGSYGEQADIKAAFVNHFVEAYEVTSVVDWGCGDGEQLSRLAVPNYVGIDVSPTALEMCRARNPQYAYVLDDGPLTLRADLSMSLDVIFHFPDDDDYRRYLSRVFDAGERFVIIHSSNCDSPSQRHVRHRRFLDDVPADWWLTQRPLDVRKRGFYVFERES
jgi:SAM-dependent methyltransferase